MPTIYKGETVGPDALKELAGQVEPASVWTAAQHNFVRAHAQQLNDKGLYLEDYDPNQWFWLGDGSLFGKNDKEAINWLTGAGHNLVLRNSEVACKQIQKGPYNIYTPTVEEVREAINAVYGGDGVAVRLSALEPHFDKGESNDQYGCIIIDTKSAFDKLRGDTRLFFEHPFGRGMLFEDSMKDLYDRGIQQTRAWTLRVAHVQKVMEYLSNEHKTPEEEVTFARASFLVRLDSGSGFFAVYGLVGNQDGRLRGVRRVAEGDAPQLDPIATAYKTLDENRVLASQRASDNDIANLASILAASLQAKNKKVY